MEIQSLNTLAVAPSDRSLNKAISSTQTPAQKSQGAPVEEVTQPLAKPNDEQLVTLVKQANEIINPINGSLQFSIDKDSGTTIVKVIDTTTKEVIKQFPSEEMLGVAKALDQLRGLLAKQTA